MLQTVLDIYYQNKELVTLAFQLIAFFFSFYVWRKIKKIESRFLLRAQHRKIIIDFSELATHLMKCSKNIELNKADILKIRSQIMVHIKTIERMKFNELSTELSECKRKINPSKKWYHFSHATKDLTLDEVWFLHATLHGLITAIKNLKSEKDWRE